MQTFPSYVALLTSGVVPELVQHVPGQGQQIVFFVRASPGEVAVGGVVAEVEAAGRVGFNYTMFTKAHLCRGREEATQQEHRTKRSLLFVSGVYSSISRLQVLTTLLPQRKISNVCVSSKGSGKSSSPDTRLEELMEQK